MQNNVQTDSELDLSTGAKRAQHRLNLKRKSNLQIPRQQREPSRQAIKAQMKRDRKAAIRHHNEEIRLCNKPKVNAMWPGTRADHRKFLSNRCPKDFAERFNMALTEMRARRAGV